MMTDGCCDIELSGLQEVILLGLLHAGERGLAPWEIANVYGIGIDEVHEVLRILSVLGFLEDAP